jgi:arsenate reductase
VSPIPSATTVVNMSKAKVLFLCTGNSARSQMAEGLLRAKAGDRFEAFSAGMEPQPVRAEAVQVMSEAGIDISGQRSKDVVEYLGHVHFGYLITVCDRANANCPMFPGVSQRLHWSLDDPAAVEGGEEERLATFRRVRDELTVLIDEFASTH